jgi:GTP cyclohydrolase II
MTSTTHPADHHLCLVFRPKTYPPLDSESLNEVRPQETEWDRQVRGARISNDLATINSTGPVLARIHSSCYTGEVMLSARCDCGDQLSLAMDEMCCLNDYGVIVYLNQEGRGIGLEDKLK